MNRPQQSAVRSTVWRESFSKRIRMEVHRMHARGADIGTIAVRLGIRVSVVSSALDAQPSTGVPKTRRSTRHKTQREP